MLDIVNRDDRVSWKALFVRLRQTGPLTKETEEEMFYVEYYKFTRGIVDQKPYAYTFTIL